MKKYLEIYLKTWKSHGNIMEFCQSEKVGTLSFALTDHFSNLHSILGLYVVHKIYLIHIIFSPSELSDTGGPCDAGYYCPVGTANPIPCSAGTYNLNPTTGHLFGLPCWVLL